jgi:DNA-binding Lrp family transcriptional regulator
MMRINIPPRKVVSVICKSWEVGLSISSLPELLGVSKPTFYKLLRDLRNEGFEARLMPNLQALGINVFLTKGAFNGLNMTRYALDPGSMLKVMLIYTEVVYGDLLSDLLKMAGVEASGPFIVRHLVCPTGEVFEAKKIHPIKIIKEEAEVLKEASENFLGIKEISKKLGMSWQSVVGIIKNAKNKGLILGPIVYWRPSRKLNLLGAIIEAERTPPSSLVNLLRSDSSVVILESLRDFTYLIVSVVAPKSLLEILDKYDSIVKKVYLAPDYPLQSLKSGSITTSILRGVINDKALQKFAINLKAKRG